MRDNRKVVRCCGDGDRGTSTTRSRAAAELDALRLGKAERNAAIRAIVDEALPVTPARTELAALRGLLRPEVLFFGVGDCLFLSLLAALGIIAGLHAAVAADARASAAIVIAAPAFYALCQALTALKERDLRITAWRGACRVSARALAACRMLAFGAASALIAVPGSLWLGTAGARPLPPLWTVALACSSLVLYALADLAAQRLQHPVAALTAAPALWAVLGVALAAVPGLAALLETVPLGVFALITLALGACYLAEVQRRLHDAVPARALA